MNEQGIVSLFCYNRGCHNCPYSQYFRTDKFTRKENTVGCRVACGDSLRERTFCWFAEDAGVDELLKKALAARSCDETYIEAIWDWCGYSEVDFL